MSADRLVLLVDDDPALLTALSGVLRHRGYDVATAPDAVNAVSTAIRVRPSVIVLDFGLPGGDGLTVMRRLRSLPQLAGTPVVMMSGQDPAKYRDDSLAAGASAYLVKPIEPDDLVAALRLAMGEDADADPREAQRIGDILVGMGVITKEQVATALARQPRLGDILREMGLVTEAQIQHALDLQRTAGMAVTTVLSGKLALLVDDDEDLLIVLAAALRRQGLEVEVATDAVTAISTALRQPPDIVVMDLALPGGDGKMVMQRLHAMPQLAGVPVIVLSGRDPAKDRDEVLQLGAVEYLVKPAEPAELIAAMARALSPEAG